MTKLMTPPKADGEGVPEKEEQKEPKVFTVTSPPTPILPVHIHTERTQKKSSTLGFILHALLFVILLSILALALVVAFGGFASLKNAFSDDDTPTQKVQQPQRFSLITNLNNEDANDDDDNEMEVVIASIPENQGSTLLFVGGDDEADSDANTDNNADNNADSNADIKIQEISETNPDDDTDLEDSPQSVPDEEKGIQRVEGGSLKPTDVLAMRKQQMMRMWRLRRMQQMLQQQQMMREMVARALMQRVAESAQHQWQQQQVKTLNPNAEMLAAQEEAARWQQMQAMRAHMMWRYQQAMQMQRAQQMHQMMQMQQMRMMQQAAQQQQMGWNQPQRMGWGGEQQQQQPEFWGPRPELGAQEEDHSRGDWQRQAAEEQQKRQQWQQWRMWQQQQGAIAAAQVRAQVEAQENRMRQMQAEQQRQQQWAQQRQQQWAQQQQQQQMMMQQEAARRQQEWQNMQSELQQRFAQAQQQQRQEQQPMQAQTAAPQHPQQQQPQQQAQTQAVEQSTQNPTPQNLFIYRPMQWRHIQPQESEVSQSTDVRPHDASAQQIVDNLQAQRQQTTPSVWDRIYEQNQRIAQRFQSEQPGKPIYSAIPFETPEEAAANSESTPERDQDWIADRLRLLGDPREIEKPEETATEPVVIEDSFPRLDEKEEDNEPIKEGETTPAKADVDSDDESDEKAVDPLAEFFRYFENEAVKINQGEQNKQPEEPTPTEAVPVTSSEEIPTPSPLPVAPEAQRSETVDGSGTDEDSSDYRIDDIEDDPSDRQPNDNNSPQNAPQEETAEQKEEEKQLQWRAPIFYRLIDDSTGRIHSMAPALVSA